MKTVTSIVYTSDQIKVLTKFHKDWMKTVTSIVYASDLINILTKFHKYWMKTVTSTVYTNKLLTDTHTHARTYERRTSHGHISSPSKNTKYNKSAKYNILAQTNRPTNRPTNQQTGQKQYVPHYYRATGGFGSDYNWPGFFGSTLFLGLAARTAEKVSSPS
ncbi:hypothetical protein DPMN_035839 [Dreissena polymorpha]|uniref:Uncharacterized protein n=1 Tax=Dreissena polymorpha TaxID=45954 RepID=A0A9D4MAD0_DREPO|nr:hypothetical protein DPMN_035839 [Dreissena polymorpha]